MINDESINDFESYTFDTLDDMEPKSLSKDYRSKMIDSPLVYIICWCLETETRPRHWSLSLWTGECGVESWLHKDAGEIECLEFDWWIGQL